MKEEMSIAEKMTSSVFGLRAQRVHLCAKRANPLIFMVFWGKVAARIVKRVKKIGMKEEIVDLERDVANEIGGGSWAS